MKTWIETFKNGFRISWEETAGGFGQISVINKGENAPAVIEAAYEYCKESSN